MANKFTKKDIEAGSDRLAAHLCGTIQSALDARAGLKDRWGQNEAVYRNEPNVGTVRLFDNFDPRTVPVMSPRINRIVNTTVSAVTSSAPWVRALPEDGDQESAKAFESGMQAVMERSGFSRTLRRALTTCALCGVSVVRARMTPKGMRLDHVHPNDFVVAPTYNQSMSETSLVGHRFYVPKWKFEEGVASGAYQLGGGVLSSMVDSDPDSDPSGRDPEYDKSAASLEGENSLIELFEVLARLEIDGSRGWYRTVVAPAAQKIVVVEKFPYERPWYFDIRLHDEEGKWWPASSVAQNIVGLCLLQNDMFNLMVAGSMASVANPVVISGGSLGKKMKTVNLGQLFETPYDVRVQEIPIKFDAGAMPGVMDIVDNQIDAQTGVTQLAIGQEFMQSQTATATRAIIDASKQNEASYSVFVSDFMEDLWSFAASLVRSHPVTVRRAYGESLPKEFYRCCGRAYRWQAAARVASAAPTLVQKLRTLLELAEKELSGYSYARVEDALVNAMQLPIDTNQLKKSENV